MKELIVTGTNLSTKKVEYYSYHTTPDMKISDAVRISAGIPVYFESIRLADGQERVDGGVLNNFPIQALDMPTFRQELDVADRMIPYAGANSQTLGLSLDKRPQFKVGGNNFYPRLISTVLSSSQTVTNETYKKNTISPDFRHAMSLRILSTFDSRAF